MTAKRAKEIAVKLWTEISNSRIRSEEIKEVIIINLKDNNFITSDEYSSIAYFNFCPLCAYTRVVCKDCPLQRCGVNSLFFKWDIAMMEDIQSIGDTNTYSNHEYAKQILSKIKEWKV